MWLDLQKPIVLATYILIWELEIFETLYMASFFVLDLRLYRWPGLLSQLSFCQPCQAKRSHNRAAPCTILPMNWRCMWLQNIDKHATGGRTDNYACTLAPWAFFHYEFYIIDSGMYRYHACLLLHVNKRVGDRNGKGLAMPADITFNFLKDWRLIIYPVV